MILMHAPIWGSWIYVFCIHTWTIMYVSVHAIVGKGRDFYFSGESKSSVGEAVPHLPTAWKSGRQDVSMEGDKTWVSKSLWTLFPLSVKAASSAGIIIQPWFGCWWVKWATCNLVVLKASCVFCISLRVYRVSWQRRVVRKPPCTQVSVYPSWVMAHWNVGFLPPGSEPLPGANNILDFSQGRKAVWQFRSALIR